mgnify:CR=1 FL=1
MTYAQENLFYQFENTSLKEVIQQLEADTQLSFSFAEDVVDKKKVTVQVDGLTLFELLAVLEAQTGLHFEKIEGQPQVIVTPISNPNQICIALLDQKTHFPLRKTRLWSTQP